MYTNCLYIGSTSYKVKKNESLHLFRKRTYADLLNIYRKEENPLSANLKKSLVETSEDEIESSQRTYQQLPAHILLPWRDLRIVPGLQNSSTAPLSTIGHQYLSFVTEICMDGTEYAPTTYCGISNPCHGRRNFRISFIPIDIPCKVTC